MLWKGEKDSMGPSMVMGWSLRAPREVTSIQWGDGPQINTWTNEDAGSVRATLLLQENSTGFKNSFNTPEYPEMSSKYLNLAILPFPAEASSAPSAFLSLLGLDFFSLKLMLWWTCWGKENRCWIRSHQKLSGSCPDPLARTFLKRIFRLFCGCCWS